LMARCNGNGRGDAALSMGARYNGKGSVGGGAALLMGACCEGKGHVAGGTSLLMAHCNGNGGGGAVLLMVRCNSNGRGDAALPIGAHYDGKGSGGEGAWGAATQDENMQDDHFSAC
jgi:hypothetical protein